VFGAVFLCRRAGFRLLTFLIVWWLIPALIYSATPYQAHRFAIVYLPAISILIGCGVGFALHILSTWNPRLTLRQGLAVFVAAVLALFGIGLLQCWNSVRDWAATHAAWQDEDRRVVALVKQSVPPDAPLSVPPRVVTLGFSAPLYHYTQWPVLELYFATPEALSPFLGGSETHLAVVPEESLNAQWANTPTGEHWRWLLTHYDLEPVGQQGAYSIYMIHNRQGDP
jgi:hypothetical protein